jgi:drug/metabolite transporter (DMT)-like permease
MASAATSRKVAKPVWLPYAVMAVGLLAVSSSSILIRLAQGQQASSLLISAWRVTFAALVLTPVVLSAHRAEVARLTRRELLLTALSGLFLGIHFASWITSLEYTSVINSSVLVNTNTLWVALATPFLLREKLSRLTLFAVAIATAGAVIISLTGDAGAAKIEGQAMFGNVLAVVGAISVAGYFLIGRSVRARVSVVVYIWLTYGCAALFLLVALFITNTPVAGLPSEAYFWMTLVGLFPQLIGHSAYNYALGYLSAAYVSLTILVEPLISTVMAARIFGELPKPLQLVGGLLILLAVLIASREETKPMQQVVEQVAEITP